jgi:hypothetical protein
VLRGRREHAPLFEQFARAALDGGEQVLRDVRECTAPSAEAGLIKTAFQLRALLLEQVGHALRQFPARGLKLGVLL